MQITSHEHLGLGVLALDAYHTSVSLLFCHPVCHSAKILFFLDLLEKPLGAECLDISRVYYIFGTLD